MTTTAHDPLKSAFTLSFGPNPSRDRGFDPQISQLSVHPRADGNVVIEEWPHDKHPKRINVHRWVDRRELAATLCGDASASWSAIRDAMVKLERESHAALLDKIGACSRDSGEVEIAKYPSYLRRATA
jgi:hypothetical protein